MSTIEEIYNGRDAFANFMVVFVDVVSYSRRVARTQQKIVSVLTECLNEALTKTNTEYQQYDPHHHGIDFLKGIVRIPTGDGAAIAFSYTGHPYIHLKFAVYLLEEIEKSNSKATSDENRFHVRTGIADDKGIIYKDINGNYNLAGRAINMASRVMDIADGNQIMLTDRAYDNLKEIDPQFSGKFTVHRNIQIKNAFVDVWQYTDRTVSCLNTQPPTKGSNAMPLTQSDLKDASLPILTVLEQIINRLDNRFLFLNGTKQIYGAVVEMINKARHNIRIVRLGSRPAVSADVLKAIIKKVSREKVTYEIVIVLDPDISIRGFEKNHESFRKLLGGERRLNEPYKPFVLETSEPICFDTIIVDNTYVGIGFTHTSGVEDLQDAITCHNSEVADNLVRWFDNVIRGNDSTQSYYEWEQKVKTEA